jgi:hypothetical protein
VKRAGITAALLALLVGMSACGASVQDEADDVEEVVVHYRGEDLNCLSTTYDRSITVTCDFERFYDENPNLLENPVEVEEEDDF